MFSSRALMVRFFSENTRILSDGAWVSLGQVLTAIGFLAGMRLLTECVKPEIFGTVSLLIGSSTLVSAVFCSPFLDAVPRFYPDSARKGQVALLRDTINAFLLKAARMLACALAVIVLLLIYKKNIAFLVATVFLCGLLAVDVVKAREKNFLNAGRKQKKIAVWLAADTWARFLAAILMVWFFGSSSESVLSGYFAGSLIILIFFVGVSRQPLSNEYAPKNEILTADIRRYALPIIPLAIVGWITSLSDRYMIGALAGLEKAGVYSAVYGLISRPFLMAGGIIEQTLRPVYFEAVSACDKDRERKTFIVFLSVTAGVSICCVAIITLWRRQIACLLLDRQYRSGMELMPWIALGYGFLVTSYVFEKICYAYKSTKTVSMVQTAGAMASLCIGVPLIYYYGMLGGAISVPIYFGIQLIFSIIMARRILKRSR